MPKPTGNKSLASARDDFPIFPQANKRPIYLQATCKRVTILGSVLGLSEGDFPVKRDIFGVLHRSQGLATLGVSASSGQ